MPTHYDHNIEVHTDYRFKVTGPEFPYVMFYESIALAKAAINEALAVAVKRKKAEGNTQIAALDRNGKEIVIRGIHQATSLLLGAEGVVFPVVPWVRVALERRAILMAETNDINKSISMLEVRAIRGYGRLDSREYDGKLAEFAAELAKKTAAAEAAKPE